MQPSKQRANVEPGAIIAGKYEIEKEIGKGGMGLILAARHLQLEERVALKFLMAPEERVEEFQERFLREARITAKLRGAHVARTLDYGVTDITRIEQMVLKNIAGDFFRLPNFEEDDDE